jgi:hypothetical protein
MHFISATPAPCASCPNTWHTAVDIVAITKAVDIQIRYPVKESVFSIEFILSLKN